MKETAYVVKLGGKLYMQSEFYSFYPATTEHLLNAKFFDDQKKAEKLARKAHGTVIELHISDISERKEIDSLKTERDEAVKELEVLKKAFSEIMAKK